MLLLLLQWFLTFCNTDAAAMIFLCCNPPEPPLFARGSFMSLYRFRRVTLLQPFLGGKKFETEPTGRRLSLEAHILLLSCYSKSSINQNGYAGHLDEIQMSIS
jgi:hypothetical protein